MVLLLSIIGMVFVAIVTEFQLEWTLPEQPLYSSLIQFSFLLVFIHAMLRAEAYSSFVMVIAFVCVILHPSRSLHNASL